MNVGILHPSSTAHPEIAMDFLDGLKAFLKKMGLDEQIHFFIESVGFGGAEKEVYQKTETLLLTHPIDVLVAFVDLKVLDVLEPLLQVSGKLVIVVNPGANYPQNWVPSANIIYLTLQHAFSCWVTGSLAATESKNAALVTSLYDCGYLHSAAMVKNFVQSGGAITYNYINKLAYNENFQVDELTGFLTANGNTEALLCILDDLPASFLYHRLSTYEEDLHLFVSPMMLEPKAVRALPQNCNFSITGFAPWLMAVESAANHFFIDCYNAYSSRAPTVFAVLGWETGIILQQIIRADKSGYKDGESLVNELLPRKMVSPRGELHIDPETHYVRAPLIKCAINKDQPVLQIIEIKKMDEAWAAFITEPFDGATSGWTNTYLCY